MEAKELRIGNYVTDHLGRLQKVAETRVDAYICYLSNGAKLKYKLNTTKPVPLTEDWLLMFGFNKVRDYPVFRLSSIQVEYNGGDNLWRVDLYVDSTVVKSVHQLQNLFFALTGEELSIK